MSIRGASFLRHPFQDLCNKLESKQRTAEIAETYPLRSDLWKLTPPAVPEDGSLSPGPDEEVS
ncbi:hypothetical protein [Leptospira licerasiae]|uniref:DUF1564 family protein n=1 Tax=Leptospira licerasiae str. MMD4847 TaxID=1049971 RepID=A0ABP2RCU8_9LEPT|nr:hypothetical protein [Leptospira licerasiae]EJZ40178.1 hypothetical protein LEP1GSC178_1341 [Leptospira licerasiae str. MMD4847]